MKRLTTILITALALAGCASKSKDIEATYISPVGYQSYSCDQLQTEAQSVSQRAAVATGRQDEARRGDVVKTTIGAVIFWPVLLFNEGNGQNAAELANLKGQMNAIQQASTSKQCGHSFQP